MDLNASIADAKRKFDIVSRALIGFAKIKLISNDTKVVFVSNNQRPMSEARVSKLYDAMKTTGVQWDHGESILPVLVPNRKILVKDSYINLYGRTADVPELRFTKVGKKNYPAFKMTSGQHRYAALKKLVSERASALIHMRKQVAKTNQPVMKKEVRDALFDLQAAVRIAEEELGELGWWAVALFDECKYRIFLVQEDM
jgi:hypothetical protein